jgi:hypothetical protein
VIKIKHQQENQGQILDEVLQRLKNKGVVLSHPKEMPTLPIEKYSALKRMEELLKLPANYEYVVSFTDISS